MLRQLLVGDIGVAQVAAILRHVRRHRLAVEFARGHEGQLEAWMARHQSDQFRAGVAARADDAYGGGHCFVSPCASRACSLRFNAGHSD